MGTGSGRMWKMLVAVASSAAVAIGSVVGVMVVGIAVGGMRRHAAAAAVAVAPTPIWARCPTTAPEVVIGLNIQRASIKIFV